MTNITLKTLDKLFFLHCPNSVNPNLSCNFQKENETNIMHEKYEYFCFPAGLQAFKAWWLKIMSRSNPYK